MIKLVELSKLYTTTNVRNERDTDLQELIESIEKDGLLQPLTVRKNGTKYEIIAGHRRFEALKKIGEPFVECNILENVNDQDILQLQLVENIQRKNMSAYEYVECFNQLKKRGLNGKMIARLVHKSESWVSNQYEAVRLLARDYGDAIPEEKKKESASTIRAGARKRITGEAESYACQGFTVKKRGHSYMLYCSTFEAEADLNNFIEARKCK